MHSRLHCVGGAAFSGTAPLELVAEGTVVDIVAELDMGLRVEGTGPVGIDFEGRATD